MRTPADLRAAAIDTIRPLGQRRLHLLAELEALDADLRPRVAHAVAMEVPYRRITELTGVAPNTARSWSRR